MNSSGIFVPVLACSDSLLDGLIPDDNLESVHRAVYATDWARFARELGSFMVNLKFAR